MTYPRPFIEVFSTLEDGWMYNVIVRDHNEDEIYAIYNEKTYNTAGEAACYAEMDWEDWKRDNRPQEKESV